MSEKTYLFYVPVVQHGLCRVQVVAKSEDEAIDKLEAYDWHDEETIVQDRECDFEYAELEEYKLVEAQS